VVSSVETVRAPFGITVEEALLLPCLSHARLLAGHDGTDRAIRVVNIMEVPDIIRWMRGGEFLLTTGYPVRTDSAALADLVPQLANRGLAALGIRIGPYLQESPVEMLAAADRLRFPVIEIPGDVTFNDVLSEVLGTILNRQAVELERSEMIHKRLTAVAVRGGSQQELITALAELIRLPVAILDTQGRTVVSAGPSAEDPGPPDETRPITTGSTAHGDIAAWTKGTGLQPHQLTAMEHAATIAAMAVAQERAVVSREQRHSTLLLMELVSNRRLNREEMLRRIAAMRWNLDVPRAAVLVELTRSDGELRIADQPIEDLLTRRAHHASGPESIVWGLDRALAMLVEPGPSLAKVCQAVHDQLARICPDAHVRIGCGRVYPDFTDLHRSYQEAAEALSLGRELYDRGFVLRHDELGVYRLLYQLPPDELRRQVDEALGPLAAYDRERRGSLVHTLECYLRNDRNGVATADELNVHYNTLRYRLGQIERLTGGIERHPMSRLQLEIAVHANRLVAAGAKAQHRTPAPRRRR
jgi:purine catabolism regulator